MKLSDNPIFLTQKRLVHRGGVFAAILIAALVGLSLLSGLIAYLAEPDSFKDFHSLSDAGRFFYGWIVGVELVVLVIGGVFRITRALSEERKAGLWDSNRLTPLKPGQIIVGYWLGAPLREFYMGVALAIIGLVMVLLAHLPLTLWLGTQILIIATALFFGLFAVLVALASQRPQNGIAFLGLLFLCQLFSFTTPKFLLTNFLLPTYGMVNLFQPDEITDRDSDFDWRGNPAIFGQHISPILLTLILQSLVSVIIWRSAVRKTANPFQPLLQRREALALFGLLALVQEGLVWAIWHGAFPARIGKSSAMRYDSNSHLLAAIQVGTLLLAMIIIALVSPQPESVRLKALRLGTKTLGTVFSHSAIVPALALTAIAAIASLPQFVRSDSWGVYFIVVGNSLSFSLFFALLLEFCRLRFRRRAVSFIALWIFVVCFLPFILAGVFSNSAFAKLSLLAPGVTALGDPQDEYLPALVGFVAGHFGLVILLFIAWRRQWKQLLARTAWPAG